MYEQPSGPQASVESLKARLERSSDPHAFDVLQLHFEDDEVGAISHLLDLYEKVQGWKHPDFEWTEDDARALADARTNLADLLERTSEASEQSNEGLLNAFLRNKIASVELPAQMAAYKQKRKGN